MMKNLLTLFTLLLVSTFTYGQIDSIGIIGSATPTGWDSDTDMIQDDINPDIWTISMPLTTGAAKFRAMNNWDVNWGAVNFPTGIGTQGGDDIPIHGGNFDITFNSATGAYSFVSKDTTYSAIGMIGPAATGAWDSDTNMVQIDSVPWVWELEIELADGDVKFRADDDWVDSWGADSFPTGIGALGGDNIPVIASNYKVTFNTATGYYNFQELIPTYEFISIIGEGAPSGDWGVDDHLEQVPGTTHSWRLSATFNDGGAKLRADTAWTTNWGDTLFPSGIGLLNGDNIPVVAGDYLLTFNDLTGEYNFGTPQLDFATIGIIGDALPTGWAEDVDMIKDSINVDQWKISVVLKDGALKFRADNDWAVNWGDTGFPTGTGVQDGDNISVFAGTWEIALNATTGVYSFTPISVGTIGPGSPTGGWDTDEDMVHDTLVANHWVGTQMLTAGEMKFRQNDDWAVNWGGVSFPTDMMATQDGDNITIPADGMYDISLLVTYNHSPSEGQATGEYSFTEATTSTEDPFTVHNVKLSPNPTSDVLNVRLEDTELDGKVNVVIVDLMGKMILRTTYDSVQNFDVDVSNFAQGTYFMQMSGDNFLIGKKFVVAK